MSIEHLISLQKILIYISENLIHVKLCSCCHQNILTVQNFSVVFGFLFVQCITLNWLYWNVVKFRLQ